jgi:hypothetical protein
MAPTTPDTQGDMSLDSTADPICIQRFPPNDDARAKHAKVCRRQTLPRSRRPAGPLYGPGPPSRPVLAFSHPQTRTNESLALAHLRALASSHTPHNDGNHDHGCAAILFQYWMRQHPASSPSFFFSSLPPWERRGVRSWLCLARSDGAAPRDPDSDTTLCFGLCFAGSRPPPPRTAASSPAARISHSRPMLYIRSGRRRVAGEFFCHGPILPARCHLPAIRPTGTWPRRERARRQQWAGTLCVSHSFSRASPSGSRAASATLDLSPSSETPRRGAMCDKGAVAFRESGQKGRQCTSRAGGGRLDAPSRATHVGEGGGRGRLQTRAHLHGDGIVPPEGSEGATRRTASLAGGSRGARKQEIPRHAQQVCSSTFSLELYVPRAASFFSAMDGCYVPLHPTPRRSRNLGVRLAPIPGRQTDHRASPGACVD